MNKLKGVITIKTNTILELNNLSKSYISSTFKKSIQKTIIIDDISLSVQRGDFISIMGKSGCGKSTLLHIIGCMDSFDSGEYLFNGHNIKDYSLNHITKLRNRDIGFIFQSFQLLSDMTVFENIELPMRYAHVKKQFRKERVNYLLEKVGLCDKSKYYPPMLSGGQQQRVAIARALANNPSLILADEPTGNLDSKSGLSILELLSQLHKEGTTLMIVTHDKTIGNYATTKYLMQDKGVLTLVPDYL